MYVTCQFTYGRSVCANKAYVAQRHAYVFYVFTQSSS